MTLRNASGASRNTPGNAKRNRVGMAGWDTARPLNVAQPTMTAVEESASVPAVIALFWPPVNATLNRHSRPPLLTVN